MSTFGKVLLFLNVMLAIIVLTLFSLSVGQEKRWSTAALLHELPVTGLPMDGDELDPLDPSTKRVDRLTKPILAGFFDFQDDPELGSNKAPVKTVLEELERVRGVVRTRITNESNENGQRKLLAMYLVPQARTIIEREELIRRIKDPKETMTSLMAELERRFEEAKSLPSRTPVQNRREQRLNIATLLFNLRAESLWRQRLMRIVGMETYVETVERQTQHLFDMAREYGVLIRQDQANFEKQYADLVATVLKESEELYFVDKFLTETNATLAARRQQVQERTTEVETAKTALAVATKNTEAEVQHLNAIQRDLFQLQLRLGQTIQRNQELEQELRKLETRKSGL